MLTDRRIFKYSFFTMGGNVALCSVIKNFPEDLQFCSYHNGECNKIHLQHYQKYIVCRSVVRKLAFKTIWVNIGTCVFIWYTQILQALFVMKRVCSICLILKKGDRFKEKFYESFVSPVNHVYSLSRFIVPATHENSSGWNS